jgi:hypothetical protein
VTASTAAISQLLHEAAELHIVFRITNGANDEWASWYAERMRSGLSGYRACPTRSAVRWSAASCSTCWCAWDKESSQRHPKQRWED